MTPAIRSYFDRISVKQDAGGSGLTEQAHKETVNINSILAKAHRTGVMPFANAMATYGDYVDADDYHSALNKIRQADAAFLTLPASLRAQFKNDAGELLRFLSDPANREAAEKLGLLPATKDLKKPETSPDSTTTAKEEQLAT